MSIITEYNIEELWSIEAMEELGFRHMHQNGSKAPVFETDEQSAYFLSVLKAHSLDEVDDQANDQVNYQALDILKKEVHDRVKLIGK